MSLLICNIVYRQINNSFLYNSCRKCLNTYPCKKNNSSHCKFLDMSFDNYRHMYCRKSLCKFPYTSYSCLAFS